MSFTTDRNDPDLGHGVDTHPVGQNKKYLVLSEEERAKGFVRPVRNVYVHVGRPAPKHPLRDLTEEEKTRHAQHNYAKYEVYPESEAPLVGRFWTQQDLDKVNKGCGVETKMARALAETYARQPNFYGATYCCGCNMHLPVGEDGEFVWLGTQERVGT